MPYYREYVYYYGPPIIWLTSDADSLPNTTLYLTDQITLENLQRWQDSVATLSTKVNAVIDALSPRDVTEVMTFQRLGDRYEQLSQTVLELEKTIAQTQLYYEQAHKDYASRVESELDRIIPMVWGVWFSIGAIVIKSFFPRRKKEKD